MKLFKELDKEGLGIINTIAFTYILNEYLAVPEDKVVSLIKVLDPANRSLINYMDFVVLVHEPNSLDTMPLFKLGDQARLQMLDKQKEMFPHGSQSGASNPRNSMSSPIVGVPGMPIVSGASQIPLFGQAGGFVNSSIPILASGGQIPLLANGQMPQGWAGQGGDFMTGRPPLGGARPMDSMRQETRSAAGPGL